MAAYVASALQSSLKLQPTSGSPSSLNTGIEVKLGKRDAISCKADNSSFRMTEEWPWPLIWNEMKSNLTPFSPVKKLVPLKQCCKRSWNMSGTSCYTCSNSDDELYWFCVTGFYKGRGIVYCSSQQQGQCWCTVTAALDVSKVVDPYSSIQSTLS